MILCNGGNHLICEQLAGVPSAAKGRVAVYHDTQVLNIGNYLLLLIVGVNLILHHSRRDINLGQKFL